MRWLTKISLRMRSLFHRRAADGELDSELKFHVEQQIAVNIAAGMAPAEARRAALREFGGVEQLKEECRDARKTNYIHDFVQDIRYGLRMLRKSPGFTAVAVLTLALGIGANTTIFSVVSAVLLRKPPVKNPDTLCAISSVDEGEGNGLVRVSALDFNSWQTQNGVFENMAAVESGRSFTLTGRGEPQSVSGYRVTPAYFRMIGIAPILGRTFLPHESQAGSGHVVVLSNSLWRERYASDPDVIGEQVDVDGSPYTIIGVMPSGPEMPLPWNPPQLWTPLVFAASDLIPSARDNHYINMVIARLKPGVGLVRAQAEMNSIAERLATEYPKTNKDWGISVLTLQEFLIREAQVRSAVVMMLVVVGLVLLMACANIAGLLLARGAMRAHEIAVRVAIGAPRARLIRQMLTESLLLGIAGGTAGLMFSVWGIHLLRAGFNFNSYGTQVGQSIRLDERTLVFTLVISLISVIIFGLVPAFRDSNAGPANVLSEAGRTSSGQSTRNRLRSALVVGEIASAVFLLAGAGVMMRNLADEFSKPVGFNPRQLVILGLRLDSDRYRSADARVAFFQQVTEKLQSTPGVETAALDNCIPFSCNYGTSFTIERQAIAPGSTKYSADYFVVGPNYFKTIQIPLVEGREFTSSDNSGGPAVAIVSRELARRYFPKGDAVGQWIEAATLNAKPARIVGIVGDVSDYLGQATPHAQIYECDLQFPFTAFSSTSAVVRSSVATTALAPLLRSAIWSVDQDQPAGLQTMGNLVADNAGGDELMLALFGIFAGLALLLASIGIYGIVAYSVSQRTREFGIRMALGAKKKDVLGLVLRQGGTLTATGCGIGIVLALPMPRIFSSLFSDFPVQGPLVTISVTLIVAVIALFACYIPARRAMRVDPMVALRYE